MAGRGVPTIIVAFVAVFAACATRTPTPDDMGRPSSVDDYLQRLSAFGFSGAVAIEEGGRFRLSAEYGWADRARGIAYSPEIASDIGSIAKQFTAAAILKLQDEGRLTTADRLSRFFADLPPDKADITLHQVLTHTAGLPEYHDTEGDFETMTRELAESRILAAELDGVPGGEFAYSNSGYSLLAAIVERVSGKPFETYLADAVLQPAGLTRTGPYHAGLWRDTEVARAYQDTVDNGSPLEWSQDPELWALMGNGGLLSSVSELARWGAALRGSSVLSARAREQLFTPHVAAPPLGSYAYGWYVDEREGEGTVVWHGGGTDYGMAAWLSLDIANQRSVALIINREYDDIWAGTIVGEVSAHLDALMRGDSVPMPPATRDVPQALLAALPGRYLLETGGLLEVRRGPHGLRLVPTGQDALDLVTFPDGSSGGVTDSLNLRTEVLLRAWAQGDTLPFVTSMANPGRSGAFFNFLQRVRASAEESYGELAEVVAVGTMRRHWRPGASELATVVRLVCASGERRIRVEWLDGKIVRIGSSRTTPPTVTFRSGGGDILVGYHLGIGATVPIRVDAESVSGRLDLVLQSEVGDRRALRVANPGPLPYDRDDARRLPVALAPSGLRSTDGIALDGDTWEALVSLNVRRDGKRIPHIFRRRIDEDAWSDPQPVDSSSEFGEYRASLSPDGRYLFFNSDRPVPDQPEDARGIWYRPRTSTGWGTPRLVRGTGTGGRDGYATLSAYSNLFFARRYPTAADQADLYVGRWRDGAVTDIRPLSPLNSPVDEMDPYVDPWERFLLFYRFTSGAPDEIEMMYACRGEDGWDEPSRLRLVNSPQLTVGPVVTPEGRYLVFVSAGGVIRQIEREAAAPCG